jgi:hypothetical protein
MMLCDICGAPAHRLYGEGAELTAYCYLCDRIGAEDEIPVMERTWMVALVGAVCVVVGLALLMIL